MSCPLIRDPGVVAALSEGVTCDIGDARGGIAIVWAIVGVGGAEDAGLGDSTSHILWALVATSFATVCASVD